MFEILDELSGQLKGEPGFSDASSSDECQESRLPQEFLQCGDLARPADEGRQRDGQVGPPDVEGHERREVLGEIWMDQLIDVFRSRKIFEAMHA